MGNADSSLVYRPVVVTKRLIQAIWGLVSKIDPVELIFSATALLHLFDTLFFQLFIIYFIHIIRFIQVMAPTA